MAEPISEAVVAFLDGDAGDIRATINADQTALLVAGSVASMRHGPRAAGLAQRHLALFPASVALVHVGLAPSTKLGINDEEVDASYDVIFGLRRKDTGDGKATLKIASDAMASLIKRYQGVTNFVIAPAGGVATLLRSRCSVPEIDPEPESGELVRASARLTFTFSRPQASNA